MSENLDLVRSIYATWERGDFTSIEWAHPEIEFVIPDGPTRSRGTGLAAMAERTRDFLGAWKDARLSADGYRELDVERVLVLTRQGGRGKTSGLDLGQMGAKRASVFHIHDGKVTRLVLYWDRDRALADLGLKEQAVSHENVEIVRSIYENRLLDDEVGHGAMLDLHIEYINPPDAVDSGERRGRGEVGAALGSLIDAFDQREHRLKRVFDVGDLVVAEVTFHGRGAASGAEVTQDEVHTWTFREGRLVRFEWGLDLAAALHAVGLAE